MAMTRLSDPTPRMTLSRALLSEGLRLARSPLTAVHLVCGLAAGLACGEYFSVARWDPALGADAYVQFLGALMPLMSAIVCGLAVDEERAAGRLANLTAVPSRGRAVAAKLLALVALGAAALAVALGVFGAVLAVAGRLPLGPAPLAAAWAGIVLGSLPLYALGLWVALRLGRNAAIGAGAAGVLLAFFSVGGLAHGLMTGELTGAWVTPLSWVPLAWPARVAEEDAVAAYGLGADDYVRKPFGAAELRAKVAAHLRRERRPRSHALSFGEVRIDLGARDLAVGGETVPLTPTEYAICEYLARHPGQVMSRAQIREAVLGWESDADDAAISMQVSRARRKLSEAGADPIATVWGMGYKWQL